MLFRSHDERVYQKAAENFRMFQEKGWLVQDDKENYYVYAPVSYTHLTAAYMSIGTGAGYSGTGVTGYTSSWYGTASDGTVKTQFRCPDGTFDYDAVDKLCLLYTSRCV